MSGVIRFPETIPDKRRASAQGRSRKTGQIQNLWDRHHQIIRLAVLGFKYTEIAEVLDITAQTVSNTLNSPLVQSQLAIMRGAADADTLDVAKRIQEVAPRAIAIMDELMSNTGMKPDVRLAAAKDILDRAGHAPVKRIEAKIAHAAVTPELLEEVKRRSVEAAQAAGLLPEEDD